MDKNLLAAMIIGFVAGFAWAWVLSSAEKRQLSERAEIAWRAAQHWEAAFFGYFHKINGPITAKGANAKTITQSANGENLERSATITN